MAETKTIRLEVVVDDKGRVAIGNIEKSLSSLSKKQEQAIQGFRNLSTSSSTAAKNMGSVRSATGNATGMMVELGRTVSDFNYGITGMANNLQQLASTFILTTKSSGGVLATLKDLGKSFLGVGGLLVIFSTAITLFERYSMKQKEAASETGKFGDALGSAGSNLKLFLSAVDSSLLSGDQLSETIENLNGEYEDLNVSLDSNGQLTKESRLQIEQKIVSLEKLAKANALVSKAEELYGEIIDLEIQKEKDLVKIREDNTSQFTQNTTLASRQIKTLEEQQEEVKKNQEARAFAREQRFEKEKSEITERLDLIRNTLIEEDLIQETFSENQSKRRDKEREEIDSLLLEFIGNRTTFLELERESIDSLSKERKRDVDNFLDAEKRKIKIAEDSAKARIAYEKLLEAQRESTFDSFAQIASNVSKILGEETAAGKGFAVAAATIDTYVAANRILKDPFFTGNPVARFAATAAAITTGLLNVKQILSVDETGKSMAGGGGGGVSTTIEAPDFNIVGASPTNQLAQTIATAEQQPLRAFVVSDDVTTAQQLDRNIIEGASLG